MSFPFDSVVLDKSGTLLEVDRTWAEAVDTALDHLECRDVTAAAVRDLLGLDEQRRCGLRDEAPLRWMSIEPIRDLVSDFVDPNAFVTELSACVLHNLDPLPGAEEMLDELRWMGVKTAVVTNDCEVDTRRQLQRLGWHRYIDVVIGCDSGWGAKPRSGGIDSAVRQLRAERPVMVGDTAVDIFAARGAGVPSVCVSAGAHRPSGARDYISDLRHLLDPPPSFAW